MTKRIVVADDERGIADPIAYAFRKEGYDVTAAYDGEEALRLAEEFRPDVMVLDVMMPRLTGYEVCRRLENRSGMGIILLTVKNDIADKVVGLEIGADDYMTKPFDMRELIARVKALLRRMESKPAKSEKLVSGPLAIHPASRSVELGGEPVELTPKEFDLLALMLAHPNRVFTRDELLDLVWGFDFAAGTRTVDIHVQRLRKKLGDYGQRLLQTVYGIGYRAAGPSA
ncbi:response regulator transcription factor [Cohnella pontilimi]|uniref:Response regulator transcription factor n=1 Tax=Cohnella pontilimi TaxID=2564100 RepID=A0A4U0FC69_9BACL|nr:response regulator transcription factor [Cohnella pontilimi]TJY42317.1 response regulator transcription factor [Cohnella pontilimi]